MANWQLGSYNRAISLIELRDHNPPSWTYSTHTDSAAIEMMMTIRTNPVEEKIRAMASTLVPCNLRETDGSDCARFAIFYLWVAIQEERHY
ncbi:hypothetical protein ACLOJK_037862 [Asimina triloba]